MQAVHLQQTLEAEQARAAGLSGQYEAAAASLQETSQQLTQLQQAHADAQVLNQRVFRSVTCSCSTVAMLVILHGQACGASAEDHMTHISN